VLRIVKSKVLNKEAFLPSANLMPKGLRQIFLQAASVLTHQLIEHQSEARDGSVTWNGLTSSFAGKNLPLTEVGINFYDGITGIAFALAASEQLSGTGEGRELCLRALAPLRKQLGDLIVEPKRTGKRLGIGGLIGVSSVLYAFLRIGQFLNDSSLLQEAHQITVLIGPEEIEKDETLDIVFGSAGALLVLLALDRVAPSPNGRGATAMDLALACADHLLRRRTPYKGGPRAWLTSSNLPPLSGFSHGAAGICFALSRLYAKTRDMALWAAVQEGLAFERGLFSPEHRNWQDFPKTDRPCLTTWCYGAPGIALSRLGMLPMHDDVILRTEIEDAVETTRSTDPSLEDHICCGNLGRAEVLLQASLVLKSPELLAQAQKCALWVIRRAKARHRFEWGSTAKSDLFNPTLFRGAAGAAYSFLRFADPRSFPCILTLD
jgi:type 2 lantibiotic biosynthesis protein LanM